MKHSLSVVFLSLVSFVLVAHAADQPNVVVLLADDLGYQDVGCYGGPVKTPAIDQLAAGGLRFTDFYSGCAVCSPSRAMLMTGQYSHRYDIPDYILPPAKSDRGLPVGTPTIASVLKKKGYVTGLIGKWHLGYGEKYYPKLFGFDIAEGFRYVAPGKQWSISEMLFPIDGEYLEKFRSNPQHTDILAERAINFIRNNHQKPFFLYLATYLPHLPWQPVPEEDRTHYIDKPLLVPDNSIFTGITRESITNRKLQNLTREYYACVSCVDRNIGKVLNVLITQVFMRQTIKYTLWEKICKLRVDIFALIHGFVLSREPKPQISIQMYTQPKSSTSQIYQGFQRTLFNFNRTLVLL
jgi:arylsulfatase A-like enzyme